MNPKFAAYDSGFVGKLMVLLFATAIWSGNEKLNCFNVKTILTFFTKTIPYIILFGGTRGISYDQIAPGI